MVPKQAGPKKNVMATICSKNLGGKFEKKDWTVNGKLIKFTWHFMKVQRVQPKKQSFFGQFLIWVSPKLNLRLFYFHEIRIPNACDFV